MTFYQLTPEVSQKLRKANLTAAEWRFWAYLTELDPWGDRYQDIDPLTITTECDISKPTYYRAKAKFQELGLFDFQEEKTSFRNLTGASKIRQSQKFNHSLKNDTASLKNETDNLKNDTASLKNETQNLKNETNESSEPILRANSRTPQTNKTYSDFLNSLSEDERESFENFCRSEVAGLPKPVASLKDYLAATDATGQPRYIEFHRRFSTTKAAALVRAAAAANALTEELYEQFDAQFRAIGCEYIDFVKEFTGAERELRIKFLEEWDRRKNNAVSVL